MHRSPATLSTTLRDIHAEPVAARWAGREPLIALRSLDASAARQGEVTVGLDVQGN